MKKDVEAIIKEIRPALQMDGGDIKLVSVEEGVVKVKLQGACHGCPMAAQTLKLFVEATLKERVKGVKKVEQV
ncbi:MAG: NifU family protein [Candidatus Nanoarchaeia archaeon]